MNEWSTTTLRPHAQDDFANSLMTVVSSSEFEIATMVIVLIIMILACASVCCKLSTKVDNILFKKCSAFCVIRDDQAPGKAVIVATAFFDYVTDVAWCVETVATHGIQTEWGLWSVLTVSIPYCLNLISTPIFLRWSMKHHYIHINWIHLNGKKLLVCVALTGNFEPALQFFNSGMFNLDYLSMNLQNRILEYYVRIASAVLNCTLEKIPQFIVQVIYLIDNNDSFGIFTMLAVSMSFVSILRPIYKLCTFMCSNNRFRDDRVKIVFTVNNMDTSASLRAIKHVFAKRQMLTQLAAQNLEIGKKLIKCQRVNIRDENSQVVMIMEVRKNDKSDILFSSPDVMEQLNHRINKHSILLEKTNEWIYIIYRLQTENNYNPNDQMYDSPKYSGPSIERISCQIDAQDQTINQLSEIVDANNVP